MKMERTDSEEGLSFEIPKESVFTKTRIEPKAVQHSLSLNDMTGKLLSLSESSDALNKTGYIKVRLLFQKQGVKKFPAFDEFDWTYKNNRGSILKRLAKWYKHNKYEVADFVMSAIGQKVESVYNEQTKPLSLLLYDGPFDFQRTLRTTNNGNRLADPALINGSCWWSDNFVYDDRFQSDWFYRGGGYCFLFFEEANVYCFGQAKGRLWAYQINEEAFVISNIRHEYLTLGTIAAKLARFLGCDHKSAEIGESVGSSIDCPVGLYDGAEIIGTKKALTVIGRDLPAWTRVNTNYKVRDDARVVRKKMCEAQRVIAEKYNKTSL